MPPPPPRPAAILLTALAIVGSPGAQAPSYGREVRPILAENCFECHGPDAAARKADLRLDIAGHGAGREILARISSDDPELRMPPVESGNELSRAEIEMLRRWIDGGAPYERHWAFKPPVRPPLPGAADGDSNPIDRFVRARLEPLGLAPSPEAQRATLVRRVYLDLIGLPPTLVQTEAFLADRRPDAYERLVDELLASPHYGERWARRWLDLARYAARK